MLKIWRAVTYLMSSIARRAELQTMSTMTELLSVCCFRIFAHLGQTDGAEGKKKRKKIVQGRKNK